MSRALDLFTSYAMSAARLGAGLAVGPLGRRPEKLLELYEFEGCPFCRKVREALSMLDLDALVRPCPKGGERHRRQVIERGGKKQFPWLVDPNTGREMYESDDIVRYLYAEYGDGTAPWHFTVPGLTMASLAAGSVWRPMRGVWARPSRAPEEPLELWSFEVSPYCRLVREALCELEIPYVLHNVAKGSPKRAAFVARSGKMQVPYLVDPNTGRALFESSDIVSYLDQTYAVAEPHPAGATRAAAAGTRS